MEIAIRPARPDDYAAYTRLFAELGVPDPVPSADSFATAIAPRMWIAEGRATGVVGYITWRSYGETAHVVQLAVDRAMRGQRIGQQLLEHVRGEARAAGCTRWYLNVKRDNGPALALYRRTGFAFELESVAMKIAWAQVPHTDVRAQLATASHAPRSARAHLPDTPTRAASHAPLHDAPASHAPQFDAPTTAIDTRPSHRLADADEDATIATRFGMPVERCRHFARAGTSS